MKEVENQPLPITGEIPSWLSGALIRNGPVTVTVNGQKNAHWFDGLAMLHAFSFHQGRVNYSNKFIRSDAYHTVFDHGSLNYGGFAIDPCRSLFKKFLTFFFPNTRPEIQNANVNVAKLANVYVALTEVPLPVKFDPQTLETLGVLDYQDQLPKEKCWESAHPHYDADQKEAINYLINYGRTSYYTLYRINDEAIVRKIIAEVPVEEPAYMHSFALTENYIVLTEYPLVVRPLDLLLKQKAFVKNLIWKPQNGTRFTVIDRKNGHLIGQYKTKPFFAFHHANGFEEGDLIHLDIVTYQDANIITGKYFYSDQGENNPSCLERFTLSLKTGEINSTLLMPKSIEFPRINDQLDGKPYRYVYAAGFNEQGKFEGLHKIDTATKEVVEWYQKGCSAGEPIFVAAPQAEEEDKGVVLTLIIDHLQNDTFLLLLDAKSFKEIGRAKAPHLIPAGLHGKYIKIL